MSRADVYFVSEVEKTTVYITNKTRQDKEKPCGEASTVSLFVAGLQIYKVGPDSYILITVPTC